MSLSPGITNEEREVVDRLFFFECLRGALSTPDFLLEYDRLNGTNLSQMGTPLDLLIDRTAGRLDAEFPGFVGFVRRAICEPLKKGGGSNDL